MRILARGFTLIEMLVVMAIFAILTSVTLASNSNFGTRITLETLAYDIALTIRQAQVYGIAVQRFGGDPNFDRGYGIHFDTSTPSSYQMFADILSGNGLYDEGELVSANTIKGGYGISDICVRPQGQTSETCGLDELDILFKRPEPDAYIRSNANSTLHELGRVVLLSPQGVSKTILVESSGQISVQ